MKKLLGRPVLRMGIWGLVGALYLLPLVLVNGAVDMFMKIEGINGESTDAEHKEWIDIHSVSVGVVRPVTGAGSTRTIGPARFSDVSVTKWIDKSSPDIMLSTCRGKVFPKVEIDVTAASADGTGVETNVGYTLYEVLLTTAQPSASSSGDPLPSESISLNYTKIEWSYSTIDRATGATNFTTNTTCVVGDETP